MAGSSKLERTIQQAHDALERENLGSALLLYRKALSMDKRNERLLTRLGQVELAAGYVAQAIETLRDAARRRPNHTDTHVLLSEAQAAMGDTEGAIATLDKVIARDPSSGAAALALVSKHVNTGDLELAQGVLDRVEASEHPHALMRFARAKVARATKDYGDAIDELAAMLDDPDTLDRHKRSARFELGHIYDAMERYDDAFACFKQANAGHNPGKPIHPDSIKSAWSRDALGSVPFASERDERPVIIAGVPRSGTTLTERVIHAHPKGAGVGECPLLVQMSTRTLVSNLDQTRIDEYAGEYLGHITSQVGAGPERVVDKHMGTEKSLGFISRALPGARVIHALRDPRDCCLSAFTQNFGKNVPYSRDLVTLGKQYVAHREMMDYWFSLIENPVCVSVYEEFVADPDTHTRNLIAFLGLEFDEACLKFHESKDHVRTASSTQVRKPIYTTSTARWKRYESHLGPLFEALGDFADGVHATTSFPGVTT